MAKFENPDLPINTKDETLYAFLSDFRNFSQLLPDKISKWQADQSSCSFAIEGLATLSMRIASKQPFRSIHIVSADGKPVDFQLDFFIRKQDEESCALSIIFDVNLNPFLKSIASGPMQQMVQLMGEKLQERYP